MNYHDKRLRGYRFNEPECGCCGARLCCAQCRVGVEVSSSIQPPPWWLVLFAWGASCFCVGLLAFLGSWLFFSTLGEWRWP